MCQSVADLSEPSGLTARHAVVGEAHVGADEHAVLQRHPGEHRHVVLDLAAVADPDPVST
jgi:hypothetical protein